MRLPAVLFASLAPALLPALLSTFLQAQSGTPRTARAPREPVFANGLPRDASYFPIGVWLQAPQNAARYRELGIDLYVGLYKGPTKEQLDVLEREGMRVICEQNDVALAHRGDAIVGWMQVDEPDNAQAAAVGLGPPLLPQQVVAAYERMRERDPTRPVLLNLGQGVAWDAWHGRGTRTNHPEDYPQYLRGCDIAAFDVYPVTHDHDDVRGKLEFVGNGVRRLVEWTGGKKPVFACIETARIGGDARPTPEQVRSEAWIAITCGARGIVWFAHEFSPQFDETGLLSHPEIAAAVKAVGTEIRELAPVLNAPTQDSAASVEAEPGHAVALLCKRHRGALWLFAASLHGEPVTATFRVHGSRRSRPVEVRGEDRTLRLADGAFRDELPAYGIRHYRIAE